MWVRPTLLAAHEAKSGPFVDWLKQLGLEKFLERYPLPLLVEWGWVVPQFRVTFPPQFFDLRDDDLRSSSELSPELKQFAILWDHRWKLDNDTTADWFLHPLYRRDDPAGQLLRKYAYVAGESLIPQTINDARGMPIAPYVDYFSRWQGYALVDVVRFSDNLYPIYSTPDVIAQARNFLEIAESIDSRPSLRPERILNVPQRWGGHAKLLGWLDQYRNLREAIYALDHENFTARRVMLKKGAIALADHFEITPEILGDEIKNRLLVHAQDWIDSSERKASNSAWAERALPHFRGEIELAVGWQMALSGKSFQDLDAEWRMPYMGNWGWAPLDVALPYEFIQHQKKFIQFAPRYLKLFNEANDNRRPYNESTLPKLVQSLCVTNPAFEGFIAAFYELHEHLRAVSSFETHGLDFRELRPLDHYALLAIRAEGCLRREVDSLGLLDAVDTDKQTLPTYIDKLAQARKISDTVTGGFGNNKKTLTNLRKDRNDPIGRIRAIEERLPASQHQLVQAFLCCTLARNYFAHHDFLDHDLTRSENAAFLLKGILLTVLVLLDRDA